MFLAPGTTLGPYEAVGQLGEGGMGQVYQASDTKVDWCGVRVSRAGREASHATGNIGS